MYLDKLFESLAKEIKSSFNKTELKEQNLAKGEDRESVIIERFLEKYLPPRFGVDRGEIVDVQDSHSRQMDIILYDAQNAPLPYNEQSGIIIFNELVFSVLEVKTNLNKKELENSFDKTLSAKNLEKSAFISGTRLYSPYSMYGQKLDYFPTLGGVIAFDSIGLKSLTTKLAVLSLQSKGSELIDSIAVLGKGLITNYEPNKDQFNFIPTVDSTRAYVHTEEDGGALLMFYLLLFSYLTQARLTKPLDLTPYLQQVDIGKAETVDVK